MVKSPCFNHNIYVLIINHDITIMSLLLIIYIYMSLLFVGEIPENFPPAFDEQVKVDPPESHGGGSLTTTSRGPRKTLGSRGNTLVISPVFFYVFSYGKWNISAFSSIFVFFGKWTI